MKKMSLTTRLNTRQILVDASNMGLRVRMKMRRECCLLVFVLLAKPSWKAMWLVRRRAIRSSILITFSKVAAKQYQWLIGLQDVMNWGLREPESLFEEVDYVKVIDRVFFPKTLKPIYQITLSQRVLPSVHPVGTMTTEVYAKITLNPWPLIQQ